MAASFILLYLLKANAALLLVAAAYFGLLRQLTFFTLNRFYLLLALLFAAVCPAVPMPALWPAPEVPAAAFVVLQMAVAPAHAAARPAAAPGLDWAAVGLALYAAGAAVLLARLLVQLLAVARLRRASRPAIVQGQAVRVLAGAVSPFSFGATIYLNPDRHPAPELAAVLRHEQVHVRQWHTLDVLLAHLALAAAWCNPAAWLLRRALLDNLEYLADHAALQTGLDRRAYQYSLLRLSHGAAGPSLVSHFTFPTLKNRVVMMNTPFSSTGQLARYFVAGPVVLALALAFSGVRAQSAGPTPAAAVRPAAAVAPATAVAQAPATVPVLPAKVVTVAPGKKGTAQARHQAAVAARPTPPASAQPAEPALSLDALARTIMADPHQPHPPVYYVDGHLHSADISDINPQELAFMSVLKGERARQAFGEAAAAGAVLVTTKQHQNDPAVVAFNQKAGLTAPAEAAPEKPKPVAYLAPAALAYITKTYPGARLLGVSEVRAADGTPQYQAEVVLGRRPGYLLFDAKGQFISDSYTSQAK